MNQARVNSSKSRIGQSLADWVAANLHVIVVFSVLVGGWVANWAMMSIRINDNTERIAKLEQRFDRDVVPRQEQEVRDRMLDQRLEQMQRTLDQIQQELRDRRSDRDRSSYGQL